MIEHIRTFFYPKISIYTYNLRKAYIVSQIEKVINRKSGFFDENDTIGRFIDKDTFEIAIKHAGYTQGEMGRTKVVGKISESQDGNSQISLKAHPSFGYYFWFFIAIIFGFIYLYKFFQTGHTEFLFWSSMTLIIGPVLCIKISNANITAIYERYIMYIHKKLKT